MLECWIHVIIIWLTECTTWKVTLMSWFWLIMTCQCKLVDCNKCPIWWGMFIVEETASVGERSVKESVFLPLNFAANWKLLQKIVLKKDDDFPDSLVVKNACQCRGLGFYSWSRKIPHAVEQLSPSTTTRESSHTGTKTWYNQK